MMTTEMVLFLPWLCDDLLKAMPDWPGGGAPLLWFGLAALTVGLSCAPMAGGMLPGDG